MYDADCMDDNLEKWVTFKERFLVPGFSIGNASKEFYAHLEELLNEGNIKAHEWIKEMKQGNYPSPNSAWENGRIFGMGVKYGGETNMHKSRTNKTDHAGLYRDDNAKSSVVKVTKPKK
jgi:hypothetical protein